MSQHSQLRRYALGLALAATLLRALLPSGYMPGRDPASGDYALVLCSAALPALGLQAQDHPHHLPSTHCSFAHSAMAALPGAAWRWQMHPLQDERPTDRAVSQQAALSRLYPQARGPPGLS